MMVTSSTASTSEPMSWRERNRLQTRASIVQAAELLMLRDGVAGTSMVEVAQLAGVSDTTVFNYFKTKTDLLDAVVESRGAMHALREMVDARPEGEGPLDALRNALRDSIPDDATFDAAGVVHFMRMTRDDPALWGAQLRTGFQIADDLAEAFVLRGAPSPSAARMASYSLMASMTVLLAGLPEDCTAGEFLHQVVELIDALGRAWPQLEH